MQPQIGQRFAGVETKIMHNPIGLHWRGVSGGAEQGSGEAHEKQSAAFHEA
jgi:hypothetical protein